jgi:succinylglutamate desuccinylase
VCYRILGGVHGNELPGIQVIERLRSDILDGATILKGKIGFTMQLHDCSHSRLHIDAETSSLFSDRSIDSCARERKGDPAGKAVVPA